MRESTFNVERYGGPGPGGPGPVTADDRDPWLLWSDSQRQQQPQQWPDDDACHSPGGAPGTRPPAPDREDGRQAEWQGRQASDVTLLIPPDVINALRSSILEELRRETAAVVMPRQPQSPDAVAAVAANPSSSSSESWQRRDWHGDRGSHSHSWYGSGDGGQSSGWRQW